MIQSNYQRIILLWALQNSSQDLPLDDDLLGTSPIDEIRNPSLLA